MDAARSADVSSAAVAQAPAGIGMASLDDRGSKRWTYAQMSAKRLGRRVENTLRVLMTG
jgi:hypothetical protein